MSHFIEGVLVGKFVMYAVVEVVVFECISLAESFWRKLNVLKNQVIFVCEGSFD